MEGACQKGELNATIRYQTDEGTRTAVTLVQKAGYLVSRPCPLTVIVSWAPVIVVDWFALIWIDFSIL